MKPSRSATIPIADVPDIRRTHLFHPERVPVSARPRLPWPGFVLEDLRTGWHLASLSHAAYHEEPDARSAVRLLGWEWEARVERNGVRADLVCRDEEVVLCCCVAHCAS